MRPLLASLFLFLSFTFVFGETEAELRSKVDSMNSEIQALAKEIANYASQVSKTQGDAKTLKEAVTQLENQKKILEKQVSYTSLQVNKTKEDIHITENSISDMNEVIQNVETRVREMMSGDATGHDWYHAHHVRIMALRIAEEEGGNKELIELAALAHDVGDRKFHPSEEEGYAVTRKVLGDAGVSSETLDQVMDIIRQVSFKGAGVVQTISMLEAKIVQDADRLYALGANRGQHDAAICGLSMHQCSVPSVQ